MRDQSPHPESRNPTEFILSLIVYHLISLEPKAKTCIELKSGISLAGALLPNDRPLKQDSAVPHLHLTPF